MNWSGIRVIILEGNPREKACVSLLSFSTRMGCCSISADKRQVCGEWKRLGGTLEKDEKEGDDTVSYGNSVKNG